MAHEDLLTAFVIVTALAVVMQAGLLLGMFLVSRRILSAAMRMESGIKDHLNPMVDSIHSVTTAAREPISTILSNLTEVTDLLRKRAVSADAVAAELLERARVDVVRVDELFAGILGRVERAAESAERGVLGPVREISALVAGIRRGFGYFFSRQGPAGRRRGPDEEQLFV